MGRFAEFGKLLKRLREPRFRSAAAASKAARLSTNYVSILERGEARPRSETVERLIRALNSASALSREDADELRRAARLAGEPAAVRSASAGPAVPNLAVWKHLPELLYRAKHVPFATLEIAFDDLLTDLVPSMASLLTWVSLVRTPPTKEQRERLITAARTCFTAALAHHRRYPQWSPRDDPTPPASNAASILPRAWRSELFAERRSSQKAVKLLKLWSYQPAGYRDSSPRLGASLKDAALDRVYGFNEVPPALVANTHDAMTAQRLCCELNLAGALGVDAESLQEWKLLEDTNFPAGLSDTVESLRFATEAAKPTADAAEHDVLSRLADARERAKFALRLYQLPDLADVVLGCPESEVLDALARAAEVLHDPAPAATEHGRNSRGDRKAAPHE